MPRLLSRRDLLMLAGGSALGFVLSPLPWKLLDDSAIWTQNWSLTPKLPRGPITERISRCTLCSAGCGVKATCVNNVPYRLRGLASDPIGRGVLCPIGLTGHHMHTHPRRVNGTYRFADQGPDAIPEAASKDALLDDMARAIRSRRKDEAIAILNPHPHRALSSVYEAFLADVGGGLQILPPSRECLTSHALGEMTGQPSADFGFDFESTKTILNFGAPLFDGWGTPGRMYALLRDRKALGWNLIHIEHSQSRTARAANVWISARPGTEMILALGIAHVIVRDRLYSPSITNRALDFGEYQRAVSPFTPQRVAEATGVAEKRIVETAHVFAKQRPSMAIVGCDAGAGSPGIHASRIIAGLNLLVGNVGVPGGVVSKRSLPVENKSQQALELSEIQDQSLRLLMVDEGATMAWPLDELKRKLTPDGIIVAFASTWNPVCGIADYVVGIAAPYETANETSTSSDQTRSCISIAAALHSAPEGTQDRVALISELASKLGLSSLPLQTEEAALRMRISSLVAAKRGSLINSGDGAETKTTEFADGSAAWDAMIGGSVWVDEPARQSQPVRVSLLPKGVAPSIEQTVTSAAASQSLVLVPEGWRGTVNGASIPPIMSKLFQESDLRGFNGVARMNPKTAETAGFSDGDSGVIQTARGERSVRIRFDNTVMPGVLLAAVGPFRNDRKPHHTDADSVIGLCELNADHSWRATSAQLRKA